MKNLYLKSRNADKEQSVLIRKSFYGQPFKYSTGVAVHPSHWDDINKSVLQTHPRAKQLNSRINYIYNCFDNLYKDIESKYGKIDSDILRKKLDEYIGKKRRVVSKKEPSFVEYWNVWLESLQNEQRNSSIKKKKYVLNSLKLFQKEAGYKLSFESINPTFQERYKEWAFKSKKPNGETRFKKDNAVNKNIRVTKTFMFWALKKGHTEEVAFQKIEKIEAKYYEPFALTKEELRRIIDLDISEYTSLNGNRFCQKEVEKLKEVKDAFVFRCFCGLRHSDYSSLTRENFSEDHLHIVTAKTETVLKIPLHKEIQNILRRWDYVLPTHWNQEENKWLKIIGQLAELDKILLMTYKSKGQLLEEKKKQYEVLSTHTARKTFITNALRAKIPHTIVMELVGMTKYSTLKRYINITDDDKKNAIGMLNV